MMPTITQHKHSDELTIMVGRQLVGSKSFVKSFDACTPQFELMTGGETSLSSEKRPALQVTIVGCNIRIVVTHEHTLKDIKAGPVEEWAEHTVEVAFMRLSSKRLVQVLEHMKSFAHRRGIVEGRAAKAKQIAEAMSPK